MMIDIYDIAIDPNGKNRQSLKSEVWRSAFLLIRHSK